MITPKCIAELGKWRQARRDWNKAHPRELYRAHLKHRYGISLEDYEAIYDLQEGRCAICREPGKKLCVDHCHSSQAVRGLLCSNCNKALGVLKDDPVRCEAAATYLRLSRR